VKSRAITGEALNLTLRLTIITVVVALFLSVSNALTADTIAHRREEAQRAAMQQVYPAAERFDELAFTPEEDSTTDRAYAAISGGTAVGYVMAVTPRGFGGAMELIVGVDHAGAVTGVVILESDETPGLGQNASDPAFTDCFVGKTDGLQVVRGTAGENEISAITSATVTSRAVVSGVQDAIDTAAKLHKEGR